jgi:hypothetical protein
MLLKRMYTGKLSLAYTYWLFCFALCNLILGSSTAYIAIQYFQLTFSNIGLALVNLFFLLAGFITLITSIGVWRCVSFYEGNWLFGLLARIAACFNLLLFAGCLMLIKDFDKTLQRELAIQNRELPKMLDDHTRLNRVERVLDVVYYHYTLTTVDYNAIDVLGYEADLTKRLTQIACNDAITMTILESGLTLRYDYDDKYDQPMFVISIISQDCTY